MNREHTPLPVPTSILRQDEGYSFMKTMFVLFLLLPLLNIAEGATYWVKGVSPQRGWQDANKTLENDLSMCWAATAANMLAWWQERNPEAAAASAAPRGIGPIREALCTGFEDGGGETYNTLVWWFKGGSLPAAMHRTATGMQLGGYHAADLEGKDFPAAAIVQEEPKSGLSARLKELLTQGYAVGIGIRRIDKGLHLLPHWHMLSLWGIEYDEERQCVTRVYLTDSDDVAGEWPRYQRGLFAADAMECTMKDDRGQDFTGLILRNRIGWFRANAVITTLIGLHERAALPD